VADASTEALLARADEVAKGWLIALIEDAPLAQAPAILTAELAGDGPRLCRAILKALGSDKGLRELELGEALSPLASRVGEIAGADGADAVVQAVDALRAVIWAALLDELRPPDPEQVCQLAERLAVVTELVRRAALRRSARGGVGRGEGSASIAEIEEQIARAERSGRALSLLLVELEDADRLLAVESPAEASAMFGQFTAAVRAVIRDRDVLAREGGARAWIIAPDTDGPAAQALGSSVAAAVHDARLWRDAPLAASVGVAVLGEDGRDAARLMEAAEESRFAAAARGMAVARRPAVAWPERPTPRPGGPGSSSSA
jgi:GGDEF domain-containing protein